MHITKIENIKWDSELIQKLKDNHTPPMKEMSKTKEYRQNKRQKSISHIKQKTKVMTVMRDQARLQVKLNIIKRYTL